MRRNQSSLSASGIAIVRALESEKPAAERVCYDPFARYFVSGALLGFVRFFDKLGYGERRGPGVMGFLVTRERTIDDMLQACLDEGLEQLVILGAGFDSRAYRFEQLKRDGRVFEVDHPATQEAKLKRLVAIFGLTPQHVTYVPIDFNEQALAKRLFESGYDERLKTLFIWQGVTQYLPPAAVDDTLRFVAEHSGAGSSIVFDYMYPSLIAGAPQHGEVRNMRRYRWLSGEQLTFGIPEGTVTAFLEARGFYRVKNADHVALQQAYFSHGSRKRTVADGYAIASATVKPRETA